MIFLWLHVAGFFALIISVTLFGVLAMLGIPVNFLYRKFIALAATAIIFSFGLATFLYLKSLGAPKDELAEGGNTG